MAEPKAIYVIMRNNESCSCFEQWGSFKTLAEARRNAEPEDEIYKVTQIHKIRVATEAEVKPLSDEVC
tara:strand:- start:983 stop:1186 length:204 start_codon:yes stop_codon:yes gene_type:complete